MSIHYTVSLHNPHAHLFHITLEIDKPDKNGQQLFMPAWIPGSYMIRDFARHVVQIHAFADNQPLPISKIDKNTWQVEACTQSIRIEYQVYAWDLSVRGAHFDDTHAFFNGTSVFLMVAGQEQQPHALTLPQPQAAALQQWQVSTTLPVQKVDSQGFGDYLAENYDALIDHPVEIGSQQVFDFSVAGTTHRMALTGVQHADTQRLKTDLEKICQTHIHLFGELPDIEHYLFLVMVTGDGYGGLEHRSSTSLLCSRDDLPQTGHADEPDEKYRNFLGLCSHEYFHTWNVKRIKPAAFMPYDLSQEVYTRQLWAFEGITSYYDELALVRSKVISINSYLELLGQTITRVLRGRGRQQQSVADSSFEAWTKFYKQDENAPNSIVSYYAKGALIALGLDLHIRLHTGNKKSLDEVMRYLWQHHGKPTVGLEEGQIETIAEQVSGVSLTDFFQRYLYGTEDVPLDTLLAEFGIDYHLRPTLSLDDKGGKAADKPQGEVSLGARLVDCDKGIKLTQVFNGESAEQAGLAAGDVIIAVDRLQMNKQQLQQKLQHCKTGDTLVVHAFRRDELRDVTLTLQAAPLTTCYLQINDNPSPQQKNNRQLWLAE